MLISICQSLVNIDRKSNTALTSTAVSGSISVSATANIPSCLILKFNSSVSGVITINGDDDAGSSITETIQLNSSKIAVGIKLFKTISSVSLDSSIVSTGANVEAKFVGKDGGSIHTTARVATAFPARISRGGSNLSVPLSGTLQVEKPKALIPFTESFTPKDGDTLTLIETNNKFIISGSPFIEMVGFNSHFVCDLERFENN